MHHAHTCCGSSQRRAHMCRQNRGSGARTWDKEVPPVAVAKRTYLTKHPYKRPSTGLRHAHLWRRSPPLSFLPRPLWCPRPPSFLPCLLWCPCCFCSTRYHLTQVD